MDNEDPIFDEPDDDALPEVAPSEDAPLAPPGIEFDPDYDPEAEAIKRAQVAKDESVAEAMRERRDSEQEGFINARLARLESLISDLEMKNAAQAVQINQLLSIPAQPQKPATDSMQEFYSPVFIGQITNANAEWKERLVNNGALADYTDGRVCTDDTDTNKAFDLGPYDFAAIEMRDPTGRYARYVRIAVGAGLFPVALTQTGGVSGTNQSANCTFTYTVKDVSGTKTLGTGIALTGKGNGWRGLQLELAAATYGFAYFHTDGTVKLIFADEYPAEQQDCE